MTDCGCGDPQTYQVLTDALKLALTETHATRQTLDDQAIQIVIELRRLGVYWKEIAAILGVSRLTASRKYLPYVRGAGEPVRYDLEDDGEEDDDGGG